MGTVEWREEGGRDWADEDQYMLAFDRVVAATWRDNTGEGRDAEVRSFGADGWVRSDEYSWSGECTWTYDALGRATTGCYGSSYAYEGLNPFPTSGRYWDSEVGYSVLCAG